MSAEYKVGQRVRIEWPNGDVVVGSVNDRARQSLGGVTVEPYARVGDGAQIALVPYTNDGRTVTVISPPRPPEPTEFGSVVEAGSPIGSKAGQRFKYVYMGAGQWQRESERAGLRNWSPWADLDDPRVLRVGV